MASPKWDAVSIKYKPDFKGKQFKVFQYFYMDIIDTSILGKICSS